MHPLQSYNPNSSELCERCSCYKTIKARSLLPHYCNLLLQIRITITPPLPSPSRDFLSCVSSHSSPLTPGSLPFHPPLLHPPCAAASFFTTGDKTTGSSEMMPYGLATSRNEQEQMKVEGFVQLMSA